jgi:hypothetical protein
MTYGNSKFGVTYTVTGTFFANFTLLEAQICKYVSI